MKTSTNSMFKKAGRFEAFLWMCAGADKDILEHCPGSDRVKYQGIGGIIFTESWLSSQIPVHFGMCFSQNSWLSNLSLSKQSSERIVFDRRMCLRLVILTLTVY